MHEAEIQYEQHEPGARPPRERAGEQARSDDNGAGKTPKHRRARAGSCAPKYSIEIRPDVSNKKALQKA
jgi:hypothetical protein